MSLTNAQLMATPGGPGVVGAVKAGNGISVSADGSVSVNSSQTITQIIAGTGVSINPTSGFGAVTISATGSGGTVTSVAASGGTTGLSFTGSPITTSGTLTLGGILAVANGGTGSSSFVRRLDGLTFNGSATVFTLQVGGAAVTPASPSHVLLFVGGIIQVPGQGFNLAGSSVTFTSAPPSGADFYGILLG